MGDVQRLLRVNLLERTGAVWMVTITAPGADLLPWDGRRVEREAAKRWNESARRRWSQLHRIAAIYAERNVGRRVTLLAYAWQMQARGVLHLHLVLGYESVAERASARAYVDELRDRRKEHGFGYVDARDRAGKTGPSTVMEARRAAGYLSRYLSHAEQFRAAVRDVKGGRFVYVARALTAGSHCTMRRLRRVRHLWAWKEQLCARPQWHCRDPIEAIRVGMLLRSPALAQAP